jgi:signal transduction histidine kinase
MIDAPHVFERFFRSIHPARMLYPGLGLGLYITSEIIKAHRGTIQVQTVEGKGSTFRVLLPLC